MAENQKNTFMKHKSSSFRRNFSWRRDKRSTQSVKLRPKDGNTGYKTKLRATNSLSNMLSNTDTKFNVCKGGKVTIHRILENRIDTNILVRFLQPPKTAWILEPHDLSLNDNSISSTKSTGIFTHPLPYDSILQLVPAELNKDAVYCLKLSTASSIIFIQTSNPHQQARWLHTILWKKEVQKYRQNLATVDHPDVLLREFTELVKVTLDSPLDMNDTHKVLLDVATSLLVKKTDIINQVPHESMITALAPLLQRNNPSPEICNFFTKHCHQCPRSVLVMEIFTPVVQQILKNVGDFGKVAWFRTLVVEYIQALRQQNDGIAAIQKFVHTLHGPLSQCPHKRILINLISVCNSAIYQCVSVDKSTKKQGLTNKRRRSRVLYPPLATEKRSAVVLNNCSDAQPRDMKNMKNAYQDTTNQEKQLNTKNEEIKVSNADIQPKGDPNLNETYSPAEKRLSVIISEDLPPSLTEEQLETMTTFVEILREISKISDWRVGLADVLQTLPFSKEAMGNIQFTRLMYPVVERFAEDGRENVVRCLLYSRDGKEGWLQIYSPGGSACEDEGKLFTKMMQALMEPGVQTGKMKKFLTSIAEKDLQVIIMLALRENLVMIAVLRDMLKLGILTDEQAQLQVVSALRCTWAGKAAYNEVKVMLESLNDGQGPTEFTLAPNSTDEDLRTLLQDGACGSLVSLTLSSTNVTSKSCELIAGLRNLKHLNLWGTRFDDRGLYTLCDALDLEYLNLCETFVTNESIQCLEAMTSLRYLNLNSTDLNEQTFSALKRSLPNLVDYDIAYTDCAAAPWI